MTTQSVWGLLLPFIGTSLGAGCAFCLHGRLGRGVQRVLAGFAAGVMAAASVWSLLLPALDEAEAAGWGGWAFVPAAGGFWAGVLFLLLLDRLIPHLHQSAGRPEGPPARLPRIAMLLLAVTLHNIPEGMAVGVVWAGVMAGGAQITAAGALALSLGIAIQNFPEGAIVSLPLRAEGASRTRAFAGGVASGAVEPLAAAVTLLAAEQLTPAMPWLLAFAAGAMLYVVVEELIPEMAGDTHSDAGPLAFALGFTLMMALDVALG